MVARRRSSRIEAFGRRGRTGLIGRGAQYADFSAGRRVVKVLSSLRNYGYELRGDLSRGPARGFVQRRCRVRLGLAVILRALFLGGAHVADGRLKIGGAIGRGGLLREGDSHAE